MTPREYHRFTAAGRDFLYLVPSAAVFELDEAANEVLGAVERGEEVAASEALRELMSVRAIRGGQVEDPPYQGKQLPPANFPLTTMVLNVTNQCNLACTYCYEYGEDKIVDTESGRKPKFMNVET